MKLVHLNQDFVIFFFEAVFYIVDPKPDAQVCI